MKTRYLITWADGNHFETFSEDTYRQVLARAQAHGRKVIHTEAAL